MARLNEAPLPTESVDARKLFRTTCLSKTFRPSMPNQDAVKRRFIRQNRELAKNNSAQCLRIRTLECDISRLLAENLNLREDILRLQSQLCIAERQVTSNSLVSVKDQLEAKLREFGSLISELGTLQELGFNQSENLSARRHPDPTSWRPDVPLAALNGQAYRMLGIMEEKNSPGGTLRYVSLVARILFSKIDRVSAMIQIESCGSLSTVMNRQIWDHHQSLTLSARIPSNSILAHPTCPEWTNPLTKVMSSPRIFLSI